MNKELYEVIKKIKISLLHSQNLTLSKKELHLLIKYINELEKEVAGVDLESEVN